MRDLFLFFDGTAPDESAELTKLDERCWDRIRNKYRLPDGSDDLGRSRWTATPNATNNLQQRSTRNRMIRARCHDEIANWTLVHFLHMEGSTLEEAMDPAKDLQKLSTTDSGSRFLI